MTSRHLQDHYERMQRQFGWHVDEHFNMAEACARRWASHPGASRRTAIIEHSAQGRGRRYSYAQLQSAADALSHVLVGLGVQRGDRVAIVLPQRFETAVAYMAVMQMGAVAMPLSLLFGPEALSYRLQNSEAVAAIVDDTSVANLLSVRAQCPLLRQVIGLGAAAAQCDVDYGAATARMQARFVALPTPADDPAVLIYTSGTTGPPKGAVIPHRALIGNLTGFVCSQNWFGFDPQNPAPHESQAVFWSPADWAWTGGLMDALLPTLYFGRPIHRGLGGSLQPGIGISVDRATPRHPQLSVPHGLESHDESLSAAPPTFPIQAPRRHERGRGRGRCRVRLLQRSAGCDRQ